MNATMVLAMRNVHFFLLRHAAQIAAFNLLHFVWFCFALLWFADKILCNIRLKSDQILFMRFHSDLISLFFLLLRVILTSGIGVCTAVRLTNVC